MEPSDDHMTRSPLTVEFSGLCIVAELKLSYFCLLGKPSSGPHSNEVIAGSPWFNSGEQGRRTTHGKEPVLPASMSVDSSTHSSFWFPFHLG
jgi:hypothetical protein